MAPRRREVIPVRHDGVVVAVLAKDTNLAVTRSPSTLELTYLDIAADLCLMVSAGTFPPEKVLDSEMGPRVGDGLVRLDAHGPRRLRQPERAVGLPAGRPRGRPRRRGPGRGDALGRRRPGRRGGGRGRDRRRAVRALPGRHGRRGPQRHDAPARAAAAGAGRRDRRPGAGPRRHRRPAARPGAADQGRDDPRDPPPREEQPADRRRAAAAAGPPDDRAGGARGAGGVGPAGGVHRGGARDPGRQPGGRRRRRRRPRPGHAHAGRPDVDRPGGEDPAHRLLRGAAGGARRRRWSWR